MTAGPVAVLVGVGTLRDTDHGGRPVRRRYRAGHRGGRPDPSEGGLRMSTVIFRRPARRKPPQLPRGEVVLESPPELTETVSGGLGAVLTYLPMLAGMGAMALMFTRPGAGALGIVVAALFAVSMAGMMVGQVGRGSGEKRRRLDGDRRDYARYLAQVRRRVRRAAQQQRDASLWHSPDPETLWAVALSPSRRWERRALDEDFATARIGVGVQRLTVTLLPPQTKPVEDLEPLSAGSLRRFLRTHGTVDQLPVAVSLRAFGRVLFTGRPETVRDLARAVLGHLAVFHTPDDLRIVICASPDRRASWDWVKWLPHALHPARADAAGPARLYVESLAAVEQLFPELGQRPRFAGASSSCPHIVVVLDGVGAQPDSPLAATDVDGVTLLDLDGVLPADGQSGALRLAVTPQAVVRLGRDRAGNEVPSPIGAPDRLSIPQAEALARLLAPWRGSAGSEDEEEVLSQDLGLMQLLGLGDARRVDLATTWRPRPPRDRLRVPIGVGPSGEAVELDIKEAAQAGMGPHGLVVGATGSGKSELLRTLVLGLAVTHSCETLNFVLVDFKGGATFARLEDLPHTSAVITNLADDLALVDRMRDALEGELNRRQELLKSGGSYANVKDYERARENGTPLTPIPSLFVVVDEFSELLTAKPDFIDLFIMIGRIGRSLGVHLLLASQRLEEGRLRGLDTYLSYRIGLRTFSGLESRVVLGVPDAYELPSAPGHGYLKVDTTTMLRFKAAYVSGPCAGSRGGPASSTRPVGHHVVPYSIGYLAPAPAPVPDTSATSPGDGVQGPAAATDGETVLDVVVDQLAGHGAPARQVWLPPLVEPPTLDELLPPLGVDAGYGLRPLGWIGRGRLQVPIGLVDKPYHQRRDPLWLDLSGAGGHVAVVGGPQSGKSTVVRDLVAGLALTHTPAEVQFYCLDFGGGALSALLGLPHLGSVAGRLAPDLVRRTMAEVDNLLELREKLFAAQQIDSMGTYRRLKAEGHITDDPYGDVFLVVDGWGTVRSEFEPLEQQIASIAARGLGYGVHVVVAATRWMEVRPALRDLLGTRIELRLGDPAESEIDRRVAVNVPQLTPGRGLTPDRLHFLSALPRIDATPSTDSLVDGVSDLVARVSNAWTGPRAPAVRLLPEQLAYAALPRPGGHAVADAAHGALAIGIDENALAPVYLDLRADPHLVVFGDARCGKTNLLRVICEQVAARYSPDEAKLVVLDYRHTLLDVAGRPHTLAHGFTAAHASGIVTQVVTGLSKRLPPVDISAERLRARDWWHGPELFFVVDDYDLVATGSGTPLAPLLDLLPLARDIGMHLVLARTTGGAGRAMFEPVIQRLGETGAPALIMSGPKAEGALFGNVRPEPLPPGRGRLVTRQGVRLVQTAYLPPAPDGGSPSSH
jgi:S-DNA-T family DNA segregation ATPase FtsK/SpoIIIE